MKAKDVILVLLQEEHVSKTEAGRRMGYRSRAAVNEVLKREDLKVGLFCRLVKALGGDVLVRDRAGREYTVEEEER